MLKTLRNTNTDTDITLTYTDTLGKCPAAARQLPGHNNDKTNNHHERILQTRTALARNPRAKGFRRSSQASAHAWWGFEPHGVRERYVW